MRKILIEKKERKKGTRESLILNLEKQEKEKSLDLKAINQTSKHGSPLDSSTL